MAKSEKAVLNDVLVAASALPETLVFRQNTGMAWQGEPLHAKTGSTVTVRPGMRILMNARPINFGLVGSGDILGANRGRPLAIETKTLTGAQREAQRNFEAAWVRAGGLYILARSVDDVLAALC